MTRQREIWFGTAIGLVSLLILLVWIPNDTQTGLTHLSRRQLIIGDAFMPAFAAASMLLSAVAHVAIQLIRHLPGRSSPDPADATARWSFRFVLLAAAIIAVAMTVSYWAGAAAVAAFAEDTPEIPATYRNLRDTAPWKFAGFVSGGFLMVFGLMSLVEGRFRVSRAILALVGVAVLAALVEIPFDGLLLLPNGDW